MLGAVLLAAILAICALTLPGGAVSHASASDGVSVQTDDSIPARSVTMIGSSPAEAPDETWGIGEIGQVGSATYAIVRYDANAGWTLAPAMLDATGLPLARFKPAGGPLAGEMAPNGSGVLLGTTGGEGDVLLVRNPGGAFTETAPLPTSGEAALRKNEALASSSRAPLIAPLEEGGGHAGALVVPVDTSPEIGAEGTEERVLHWDGEKWTSEPIEVPPASKSEFRVLAIGASSAANAWLLAQLSSGSREVALFHRVEGTWKEATPAPLSANGALFTVRGTGEPPTQKAQTLTVTSRGIWVDGERTDVSKAVTLFFAPPGEGGGEGKLTTWCGHVSSGTQCDHELAEGDELPTGSGRSYAWASEGATYGERVITGLREGVSLRLEGENFSRVLGLGASEPPNDVGGSLGAAFSSATEGWLGNASLPVHITGSPAASQLTQYPVPFRHALTAVAPQPGVLVGSSTSEALAVGDQGEVARYIPSEGWQPETLFGPGQRDERPVLRAVAWPTPQRAYAVGQEGAMWLWRGETGLWEPDPAAPVNFIGDLLGIAFDPSNSSRGYAVGQQGVLLRYGKTWAQEALPAEVAHASFTSIAFAGSEAIVAYRIAHRQSGEEATHYTGGLLVNEGSGWHVDAQAAQALAGEVPWAVAGLPDGGAAISATEGGQQGTTLVLERQAPAAQWVAAPPYPGVEPPGSLTLFREGGAVRAIGAGGLPNTLQIDTERSPPAGFPPNLVAPYPLATGYVVRQTAGGWRDEEHERNGAQDPPGEYKAYDSVYQPDPTSAVLVNEAGSEGWAVGGVVDQQRSGARDTSDVARYPTRGGSPPGAGTATIPVNAGVATFAIGGGAGCLAPCADRANARLGPDVWLQRALEQAHDVNGLRAFVYTGPRVTSGIGHGLFEVPWEREFARYRQVLEAPPVPTYATPSPTDRGPGSECEFQHAFEGAIPGEGLRPLEGCPTYYAVETSGAGGPVRVIVLDESRPVDQTQLSWLAGQLAEAQSAGTPAVVVGTADLNAEIAAGEEWAREVADAIIAGNASAYFYDAPDENVTAPLRRNQTETSSIPTFGSGTLGYVSAVQAEKQDFIGHNGFLLVEVGTFSPTAKRAGVNVRLIPNVGELAIEAKDGVLLQRSHVALFAGLARRPRSGGDAQRGSQLNESSLYIPIPANCFGARCASGIFPEYTFSSSREDIGDFVEPNLATGDPHAVLPNAEGKPVHDASSGLFCAYNAGSTVVTLSAGGLTASLTVTVQPGSVREPCGTVKLKELPATQKVTAPPPPAPAPTSSPTPSPVPIVPPPPVAPATPAPPAPPPPPVPPFVVVPAQPLNALIPFVPPPPPTPARPTPPSGMSQVVQSEEEEEEATESVSNQAVAYRSAEHDPSPAYILGFIVLAAFAGASARRRPRRGPREVTVAPATVSARRRDADDWPRRGRR